MQKHYNLEIAKNSQFLKTAKNTIVNQNTPNHQILNMKNSTPILVISGQQVSNNSKINWPDLNYPGSGQTILRTIHNIDYGKLTIQLDGVTGPKFSAEDFPEGVGFYRKIFA
jgi:hypothetical protein